MQAKFCSDGTLQLIDNGKIVESGAPNMVTGDFGISKRMDWAVSLMKHTGRWIDRPWNNTVVSLSED